MENGNRTALFYVSLVVAFLLSRILFFQQGVEFHPSIMTWAWQTLDGAELHRHLGRSLLYLHAQPPLYNLLIGICFKIWPQHPEILLEYCYLTIGLLVTLMLGNSLRRMGVSPVLSFVLTVLFFCSPAVVLYENWGFYTQLELFGMVGIMWAAVRYYKGTRELKFLILLFSFAGMLCLTRSLYHLVFFLSILGVVLGHAKQRRKQVLAAAAVPFLLTLGWYVKNALLFGSFSASTWFGMNFANMSYPEDTELGKIGLWKSVEQYDTLFYFDEPPYTAPVVYAPIRENGTSNYNHYAYIAVAKRFQQEAVAELKKNPAKYQENVERAILIFFEPASQLRFGFLGPNYEKLTGLDRFYQYGFHAPVSKVEMPLIIINMVLYALFFVGGIVFYFLRKGDSALRPILMLLLFLVLFVFIVGNLFEVVENNRFRFPTIPPMLLLAAVQIQALVNYFRQKKEVRKPAIR